MSTSDTLSERDLRALTAIVGDGRADPTGPGLPVSVLQALLVLVPADALGFAELDLRRERRPLQQAVEPGIEPHLQLDADYDPEIDRLFWNLRAGFRACGGPNSVGREPVVRWSDVYTARELNNEPLSADFFRADGIRHALCVPMPSLPGYTRRLTFWRCAPRDDFTDRERLLLEVLRPHLYEIYLQVRRAGIGSLPDLTPREREVLDLVAQGYGNAAIAATLFIAVSTVRKHIEHIFDQTGVRTRAALIARYMPLQVPPPVGL